MTAHDVPPARLLDTQATPRELRDALQALRERAPSAEAAARIEQRLGQPVQAAARVPRSLIALGLLALFGAAGLWVWPEHQAIRPPRSAARWQAPSLPLPAAIAAPAAPSTPAPRAPRAPIESEVAMAAAPQPSEPAAVSAPAALPVRALKRAKAPPSVPQTALAIQPVAVNDTLAAAEPAPAETVARNSIAPPPEDAERVFADPQDEPGLLYRARRLSSSDPSAALRLLVLHEASFPEGAFVQERDMLEIQIHERLGHAATAKRLAALFKQRYPESVYRVSP
jgi:hypothetical protein